MLRTGSCGKKKGGVACAEAVLALAICEVHVSRAIIAGVWVAFFQECQQ